MCVTTLFMAIRTIESVLNLPEVFKDKALVRYVPNGVPSPRQIKTLFARISTNCYSASLGIPLRGLAHPGFLKYSVKRFYYEDMITTESVHKGLLRDGFEIIDPKQVDEHGVGLGKHIVAVFVSPKRDFHMWTLCNDGSYYAKIDKFLPFFKKCDAQSVKTLADEWHPEFVGTYVVPDKGIEYYPRLALPRFDLNKIFPTRG